MTKHLQPYLLYGPWKIIIIWIMKQLMFEYLNPSKAVFFFSFITAFNKNVNIKLVCLFSYAWILILFYRTSKIVLLFVALIFLFTIVFEWLEVFISQKNNKIVLFKIVSFLSKFILKPSHESVVLSYIDKWMDIGVCTILEK